MFLSRRSRRLALSAAVIITLSSCGSTTETASTTTPTSTSTSAAASADTPEPAVIQVAGGALPAGGQASGPAPMDASDDAIDPETSRMSMAALIDYVYGGVVTDLTAPAGSWFFAPGAAATTEQVAQLAAVLGVEGDVREVATELGGGWIVGSDDYTAPSVSVGVDATLSWWFNAGSPDTPVSSPCVLVDPAIASTGEAVETVETVETVEETTTPVETTVPDELSCPEPTPPTGVPSAADAEALATTMMTDLGLDPASYEMETYADEWGASVSAFLVLDGVRTPMSFGVGYGADAAVTWATGFLASPQRGGEYPRIGIEAAVQRLNELSTGWMNGSVGTARTEEGVVIPDELIDVAPTSVDAGTDTTTVKDTTPPFDPVQPVEPIGPTETITPPEFPAERVTVTLTGANPSLESVWAEDGTVWLLPGYAFDSADGGRFTVIAVADEYLAVDDLPGS